MSAPPAEQPPDDLPPADDADTGLPGLRTWRAVYVGVFTVFVLWVVLLAVFARLYS